MRTRAVALAVLALAPAVVAGLGSAGLAHAQTTPPLGERAYGLVMEDSRFNGERWPDTPVLEAYAGETMRFAIHVPLVAEMHTFHLHGHPWQHPDTGAFVDAVRLDAGESHRFTVRAGLEAGHAGDWFYHCHVETHFQEGMWGLLRVYPYAVQVDGDLEALQIQLTDGERGLEQASFEAHLRADHGPVTAADLGEGEPVPLDVRERGEGAYQVTPELAADAGGQLVLTAHHAEGQSVARLDLVGDGYELARDVAPGTVGEAGPGELADAARGLVAQST